MSWINPDVKVVRGWSKEEVMEKAQKIVDKHPELNLTIGTPKEDTYRIFIKPWVVDVRQRG